MSWIYRILPEWSKGVYREISARIPMGWCLGKDYRQYRRLVNESQWWPPDKIKDFQERKLARLIEHCYANVPYYRSVMDERILKPQDITTTEDLPKLPFLTKALMVAIAGHKVMRG